MTSVPHGARAVMASRRELPDSLEFFPTPPWATRALLTHVLTAAFRDAAAHEIGLVPANTCWEPAAGEGHMSAVLGEQFAGVWRSDVHDYGGLNEVGSFVGEGLDVAKGPPQAPDWVITNPPFSLGVAFVGRGLDVARVGVALLLRSQWLEGVERYETLFRNRPPAIVAPFVERVPMAKGRWDPDGSTATAYAWFVWTTCQRYRPAELRWIPPGCRQTLEHVHDRTRFAAPLVSAGPDLLGGAA